MGPHLATHREEFFVAGKTLRANPDGVTAQFDETRRLLHAEVLDLYQAHGVTTLEELDRRSDALERILELHAPRAARASPASPGTTSTCPGSTSRRCAGSTSTR